MNYGDPTLRDHLAAEYALGTLRGRARRRFERLMAEDRALRELVAEWEARLGPLAAAAAPVDPPADLWRRIEARLGPSTESVTPTRRTWFDRLFARPAVPIPTAASAGLWYCVGFWRTAALVLVAAMVALAIHVATLAPPSTAPTHIAVLAGEDGRPALLAKVDAMSGRIELTLTELDMPPGGNVLELWLLPAEGAPRSLGLIDAGGLARKLDADDIDGLTRGALAVSLEPEGGSPTGRPSGPVLYSGPVVSNS